MSSLWYINQAALLGGGENQWWLNSATDFVTYHQFPSAYAINDSTITSPAGGRTYILDVFKKRISQDGYIRRAYIWPLTIGGAAWKFKLFRPNGANYDFVSERSWTPAATDYQTVDFGQPIECHPGDVVGVFIPATDELACGNPAASNTYAYADGDISTTNAFVAQVASRTPAINYHGYPPFAAFIGDSLFEGHNTATYWHSWYDGGPTGNPLAEVGHQIRAIMPKFEYQNYSLSSQTYNWINLNGFTDAYTNYGLKAKAWIIMAGVNDISTARAWALTEADLDAIKARCLAGDLWICEVLPWTNGTDAEAATLRTFNTKLAVWCAANSANLILCHDAMGKIRVATGELDDLATAYDYDGIHLTATGVDKLASIIKAALKGVYK